MKNKVDFKVFKWAIGILITIISWQTITISLIRIDIGSMQTDISWIKKSINEQNNISLK